MGKAQQVKTTIQVDTKILIRVKHMLPESATGTLASLSMHVPVPSAVSCGMCG